ncbi:hypothetical protein TBS_24280 [Thermobispora bispora]|uniref:Hemerythrin-like domain-containing protein n=1 Tax=Thermobispora bispora (strain ATCC 19993 / DSM 43833 / CBS 139.67 / JCM 10125 / KCTC 9307 / NBRC 14880 / R51) TaxID=469371 RepID=D6Y6I3_THEBD|nr:hemerythrin domain-containing protein [Thermobispora bispora]ADG87555.1 hypothetical protein Tbis_0831 [Thermobispora bispora DSM 43833]MBO2472894.1 hemerythrin domain-containing protein [Actinomycetales bacterium]MBX6167486.1 hemerythrin domain-containing protein [Thermobispora bispora]MDI9582120.1 hemerythrin domain-containing protein [Thermobispora sp.]
MNWDDAGWADERADPLSRPGTMPETDIIDLLMRQHTRIRELVDEVERYRGAERRNALARLTKEISIHEAAEREIVHAYARHRLAGGASIVAERLKEEDEAVRLLHGLGGLDPGSPEFAAGFERFRTALFAHFAAEERYEFSLLRAAMSEEDRRTMAVSVQAAETMAALAAEPAPGTPPAEGLGAAGDRRGFPTV